MTTHSVALMSLEEVANSLRVSKHTIRSWVTKGRLQPVRICRRLLFAPRDIEAFIERGITKN
jgi:excisionase family DNA binding protein